jgi:hypothetical protein
MSVLLILFFGIWTSSLPHLCLPPLLSMVKATRSLLFPLMLSIWQPFNLFYLKNPQYHLNILTFQGKFANHVIIIKVLFTIYDHVHICWKINLNLSTLAFTFIKKITGEILQTIYWISTIIIFIITVIFYILLI